MNRLGLGFILAALAIFSVGCTGSDSGSNTDPSTKMTDAKPNETGKKLKIGMVFDSGGKGDKSFNDSAYAGLSKAETELGVETRTVDSKSIKDYETNLDTLAEQGFDLIFAIGFTQGEALRVVAPKHPNTKFAIVDAEIDGPNIRSLLFSEEQGSYLAGYAASLTSKSGKIGFVGGKKIPLIEKFEAGYRAGALAANPKIVLLPSKYTESWDDTQLGKEMAKVLFNDGADIVYHAAGRCGIGVITAAKDAGKLAIGVDSDQDDVEKGSVLTSMIKRVDVSVFQTIKDVKDGSFAGGRKIYDLKGDGVGLSDFRNSKDKIPADLMTKLDAVKKEIVDGKVQVPTTLK